MLQPKKPVKKYVPTAKEKKNLEDASSNKNMRPPFTNEERKKMKNYSNMGSAKSGSSLKPVSSDKVGLKKLPTAVRNKMGYQKNGGTMNKAKSGTSLGMKSVKSGYDDNSGVTRADFVSIGKGEAKNGTKMKMGGKMAKQAAVAIAKKKAGKAPKKAMGYGGKAASMAPMKSGGKMEKCKDGCK